MRVITFDIEIAKPIDSLTHGWEDAKKGLAGIASVVLYDTGTHRYHLYDDVTIGDCVAHLNQAELLVGFNNREFDTPAIEGYTKLKITPNQYDILQAVWHAIGKKHKGYGLGPICERTLGLRKSGDGESAPRLLHQHRYAELFDYNLNDVYLTHTLFEHIMEFGYVIGTEGQKIILETTEGDTL